MTKMPASDRRHFCWCGDILIRRHCERSEAIHLAAQRKNGLLRGACHRARIRATRWLAMTVSKRASAPSPRNAPEPLTILPPNRGRRERRVLAAPAVSCAKVHKENAHEHTGTVGASRHSLRNGFTAYAALSPATNSSCHRRRRITVHRAPGWARKTSADLTPATGARTTRFCRTQLRRSSVAPSSLTGRSLPCDCKARPTLPRPPHPIPT
jgi:hypothetical protein